MNGEATRNRRGRQQKEKRRERQGNLCSLWLRDWDIRHPAETEGITSSPAGPLLVTQTTKSSHHSKGLGCSPCFMPQAKQQRHVATLPLVQSQAWGQKPEGPWPPPGGMRGPGPSVASLYTRRLSGDPPHDTGGPWAGVQQYLKTKLTSMTWQRLKNETLMGIKVQRIK